ncbi:bifunctional tetrahydrofolate synthase/dihydrofolate synthase [Thiohalomonas denitrificans]|uniref:Dihydrofolate synthase/folylpolyglutamate synthase n=1 Tax=Thiohalomonas denitrificans TaxID=415747 RepID=A0A1G5QPT1_9GAMM|nr:bifunctional tetrahydrofolate synthase/dihydrofolate synthase [Thiohalomonas denitrificans]SCZ63747.1 dihydrofolate synthase / folylpolyglutamate synthase [Thiohalomonas denitrificans]
MSRSARFSSLDDWLAWQETLHPAKIELGLERLGRVLARMGRQRAPFPVITVAGTNGKGSSVAMLEAILRAAGYRVGTYTSPHLLRYTERIRIDGREIDEPALCDAFETVDKARGDISLTYFEFGTLAAFDLFFRSDLDVAVLEVGMGGRLDAVNAWDPDVALVTAVDVDHAAWLGSDRETIGREKAGIFRAGRPAVCSDPQPPYSLIEFAREVGAPLYRAGDDYRYRDHGGNWSWTAAGRRREALPWPIMRGVSQLQNAAGVLMALDCVSDRLPVDQRAVREGLLSARVRGRFEVLPGDVPEILDVAHNPQAAEELARNLVRLPAPGRTLAVFAVLADKDIAGIVRPLAACIDHWFVAGLGGARPTVAGETARQLEAAGIRSVECGSSVPSLLIEARRRAEPGDRIVVFGSFNTVAEALAESV